MLPWLRRTFEFSSEKNTRLESMEGLRGAAVFLVFIHHYTTQALFLFPSGGRTRMIADTLRNYGNLGVELFFILSGFLIYGTLVGKRPAFAAFMARRIERIYPAFLVILSLETLAQLAAPGFGRIPHGTLAAVSYLVENLLLLPGLWPIEPIVIVAWSLSYEIFFYIVTAIAVSSLRMSDRSRAFRMIAISGVAAVFTGLAASGTDWLPVRMMPFFAGMLLWEAVGTKRFAIPGAVGLAAPVVAFILSTDLPLSSVAREWTHTMAFFALCAACFRSESVASRLFSWRPLRWLGNMSYSYYLVHGLAVKAACELIARALGPIDPAAEFWLLLVPVFLASLVPSAVLFIAIEKPISLRARPNVRLAPAG